MSLLLHVNAPHLPPSLRRLLGRAARVALRDQGVTGGEVSLTVLDDGAIRTLNHRYLGRDSVTDVIAFRLDPPPGSPGEGALLGDVYLGGEQAARQAAERRIGLPEELVRLAVHGVLHLVGHDHPEGAGREESPMFRLQEALVSRVMEGAGSGSGEGA